MSSLEYEIEKAKSLALSHAEKCSLLIKSESLASALSYCQLQNIESPQCSLTAQTANAEMLRNKAKRMLSDAKWWARRLERQALQNFEQIQRSTGKVTNFISNESYEYILRKK